MMELVVYEQDAYTGTYQRVLSNANNKTLKFKPGVISDITSESNEGGYVLLMVTK